MLSMLVDIHCNTLFSQNFIQAFLIIEYNKKRISFVYIYTQNTTELIFHRYLYNHQKSQNLQKKLLYANT